MSKLPVYFLSHGGGPWPWMMKDMPGVFDELNRSLKEIPKHLEKKPKAILVITAHWISQEFVVSSHPQPPMIYDFGGFPEHLYNIKYPAPGSPELAMHVHKLLQDANLPTRIDPERGFDHGTYTVIQPMYPNAEIPVVQLSIQRNFDPLIHMKVGKALAQLRMDGILIIGSGLSYHNLRLFGPGAYAPSSAFDQWLQDTLFASPEERWRRLLEWQKAPQARMAHPREDHLIPLMVAVGASEHAIPSMIYHEETFMGGCCVSSFRFD